MTILPRLASRLSWITRAPWRRVMTAFGHRFHSRPIGRLRYLELLNAGQALNELASSRVSRRCVNWVRVFMLVPIFGPNADSLPSPFGQGAGVP